MRDVLPSPSSFARLSPRDGRADAVHLAPATALPVRLHDLHALLDQLADHGVRSVRTAALNTTEMAPFAAAGFRDRGRLALLSCGVGPERRDRFHHDRRVRSGRSRHHRTLLEIDARCFPEPWRFDHHLLVDALSATPISRLRVVGLPEISGYAIFGAAGITAYLQRLAVDPKGQRQGLGRALVDDGRRWAARRGATSMMVNTALDNTEALAFYESLGFERQPSTLVIMERELDG